MRNVKEISDDQLIKCMKDYLGDPARYHPDYLRLLTSDYERRVIEKRNHQEGNQQREFVNINTSKNVMMFPKEKMKDDD